MYNKYNCGPGLILFFFLIISTAWGQFESSGQQPSSEKQKVEKREKKEKKDKKVKQQTTIKESSGQVNKGEIDAIYERLLESASEFNEEKEHGNINWTSQYIEARGETLIDTSRFKNYSQARAMAIRGAVVVAQRNLLEIINGVKIHGETTVENLITTNDYIYSRVDGVIKGAVMVGEPREEWGMMVVTLQAPLYQEKGLASAVYDAAKPVGINSMHDAQVKVGKVSQQEAQQLENFIFNLAGKQFDPALFPLIVDENNNVLLDLYKIYDPKTGKFPKILQTSREIMEEFGFKKGIEIIDIVDAYNGKLVVNQETSRKINWDKVMKTAATIGKALLLLI
jgi:hypothetical protein